LSRWDKVNRAKGFARAAIEIARAAVQASLLRLLMGPKGPAGLYPKRSPC